MPLYEYRCKSCGHRYEKIQKVNDEPDKACPQCGGEVMRPLTAPAFQFKGAGWYVNDYAPKSSSSASSEKATSESSGESKTESKPAESKASGESTSSSSAASTSSSSASAPAKPASSSSKE